MSAATKPGVVTAVITLSCNGYGRARRGSELRPVRPCLAGSSAMQQRSPGGAADRQHRGSAADCTKRATTQGSALLLATSRFFTNCQDQLSFAWTYNAAVVSKAPTLKATIQGKLALAFGHGQVSTH